MENNKLFGVKNGQINVVKAFHDGILTVQSESGMKNINTREYDKVDHAYAITLHKSQGKTFDNVIVVADKMMDASTTYVAMTRHRENVDLYYKKSDFGSFKELANSASKYIQKDSLVDYKNIENISRSRVYEYKEEHGYAPYVSKAMVMAYACEHNLKMEFYDDSTSHEYASMLAQRSSDAKNLKEPTLATLENSIKQALCFKALYESNNVGELTSEKTKELHLKAAVLSEHITKENLHVFDNREFMKEAFAVVDIKHGKTDDLSLTPDNCSRLVNIKHIDIVMEQQSQQKSNELCKSINIEKSNDFEISI